MSLSPWTTDGININYPVWVAWLHATPRWSAPPSGRRPPCRYALLRNTLQVETPDGWPAERSEVLCEVIGEHGITPPAIDALWWPGCGYSLSVQVLDSKPPRKLSETAKHSIRRKALTRRIQKAAPLFAEDLLEEALAEQPEYYGLPDKKPRS